MTAPSSDQAPVLSVAELNRRLRNAAETATLGTWVQGEVRGLKKASSGHLYFNLRDETQDAVIEAVAYREAALRARQVLVEGARVLVRGKATVWPPRGRLQFVVEVARSAGRGTLLEALERLKEKLRKEGLFDSENKLQVPHDARYIGVVTSKAGAVIHDIIRVAFRRGCPSILLCPATVQGEDAARSIVASLMQLQRVRGLDAIIVARGGGSFEDLMPFNDERVVRQVALCPIPVVSAVGHEVDMTLTDLAADARAATPSQAAELIVADQQASLRTVGHLLVRMQRAVHAYLREDRATIESLEHRLGDPQRLVYEHEQRWDDLVSRARESLRHTLARHRVSLERLERRLVVHHPRAVTVRTRGQLDSLYFRMVAAGRAGVRNRRDRALAQESRLRALSPLGVLGRGYAIAMDGEGRVLMDARGVEPGAMVKVRLLRGRLSTEVVGVDGEERN